ncbi:MAG TPA: hypothetical protein VLK29_12685 [Luteimonas sp.]|nr:hypothetical protein [Luteimonas sp.]
MAIEAALIKPVVDALLSLFRQADDIKLKRNADSAVREAIRELLQANPDENRAEARIAIAKAAGILSEEVVLAEDMLKKHRATKARTSGKGSTGRRRAATEPRADRAGNRRPATGGAADDAGAPLPPDARTPKPAPPVQSPRARRPADEGCGPGGRDAADVAVRAAGADDARRAASD